MFGNNTFWNFGLQRMEQQSVDFSLENQVVFNTVRVAIPTEEVCKIERQRKGKQRRFLTKLLRGFGVQAREIYGAVGFTLP